MRKQIPRKGTETSFDGTMVATEEMRKQIPRKGTETNGKWIYIHDSKMRKQIPRKGTETLSILLKKSSIIDEKTDTPKGDGNL
mgnify:CR=1 FL=1